MKETAAPSPSSSRLPEALLEYFSAPGKYQLSLREPALLFSSVREILQIAAGRGPSAADNDKLRQAAVFFIRAALLFPGADHYAVLGYAARAEAADVKERYRLLMRLTHPDFATAGAPAWPADAAVRVNRAYEVLSSPLLRREYDEQLGSSRAAASPAAPASPVRSVAPVRRKEPVDRSAGKKLVAGFAALFAIAGIVLLLPRSEPDQLVQRNPAPLPARERQAQVEEASATAALPATLVSSERLPSPQAAAPVVVSAPESAPVLQRVAVPAPEIPVPAATAQPALPAPAAAAAHAGSPAPAHAALPVPAAAPMPPAPAAVPVAAARRPVQAGGARPAPARTQVARAAPEPKLPVLDTPIREWQEPLRAPQAPTPAPAARPLEPVPAQPPVVAAMPIPPAQPVLAALPIPLAPPPPTVAAGTVTIARAVPSAGLPAPTLADAQPVLTQLLHIMESTGSGDQLIRLLDAKARQAPGARGLSRQFDRVVQGGRPVRLSQVVFEGETRDGVLLVTGRMRVHAGEPTIGAYGQKFVMRAEFTTRAGKTLLTGLSGEPE